MVHHRYIEPFLIGNYRMLEVFCLVSLLGVHSVRSSWSMFWCAVEVHRFTQSQYKYLDNG